MAKTLGDITQELTEKVLSPAKAEASGLLDGARQEAAAIVAGAQAEAERIRAAALREAEETRRQLQLDLDAAARNFLIMVQERLEAAVVPPVVEEELKAVLDDPEFLKRKIEVLLTEFQKHQGREQVLELLLPEQHREELERWYIAKFRQKAAGQLVIRFSDKIRFGFHMGTEGEGSYFNFSSGLIEAFVSFCSPRFRKHFFAPEAS